ncbi:MAG: hydroxylamine reductase [Selenomonadaceae bacterium]|nr:hydroxylamine reductase [Selenomonadaceae bacterium]
MSDKMFCNQCQETAGGKGCTVKGVCGKTADVANRQDDLIYATEVLSTVTTQCRAEGIGVEPDLDHMITRNLFMTITNANFDLKALGRAVDETDKAAEELYKMLGAPLPAEKPAPRGSINADVQSLRDLILYGLKGLAAYLYHANQLGYESPEADSFIQSTLAKLIDEDEVDVEKLTALALETGKHGVDVMALLDKANTKTFGDPEVTTVKLGVGNRPGILISGHDFNDLKQLLEQTKDAGVDVYTHGEMLPAHYYPELKKYPHLVGNYGNAWWQQKAEFKSFNGAILLTTNCLVPPDKSYIDRVFTTGAVGFDGCVHIDEADDGSKDFTPLIECAKACPPPTELETGSIVGGFAHTQALKFADKIIDAVKSGAIKKFVVMAGCDGRMKSRQYYADFARALPKDTVILTAGCAKYKYIKLPLGDIGGIPRVLDAGQCNDSYSLVLIALALRDAFKLDDVNELPVAYNIAWYEQKAVIVLLALLYLGVKNIHLGPTLPAFLSPNVASLLVKTFGIGTISNVEDDLKTMIET